MRINTQKIFISIHARDGPKAAQWVSGMVGIGLQAPPELMFLNINLFSFETTCKYQHTQALMPSMYSFKHLPSASTVTGQANAGNKVSPWIRRCPGCGDGGEGLGNCCKRGLRPIPGDKYHNGRKPRRGEAPNLILGKRKIPALGPEDGRWAERPGADVKWIHASTARRVWGARELHSRKERGEQGQQATAREKWRGCGDQIWRTWCAGYQMWAKDSGLWSHSCPGRSGACNWRTDGTGKRTLNRSRGMS